MIRDELWMADLIDADPVDCRVAGDRAAPLDRVRRQLEEAVAAEGGRPRHWPGLRPLGSAGSWVRERISSWLLASAVVVMVALALAALH